MIFRPYDYFETGCASYLFGGGGLGKCAVVDAHERDLDAYAELVNALSGVPPKPVEMDANQGRPEPQP